MRCKVWLQSMIFIMQRFAHSMIFYRGLPGRIEDFQGWYYLKDNETSSETVWLWQSYTCTYSNERHKEAYQVALSLSDKAHCHLVTKRILTKWQWVTQTSNMVCVQKYLHAKYVCMDFSAAILLKTFHLPDHATCKLRLRAAYIRAKISKMKK